MKCIGIALTGLSLLAYSEQSYAQQNQDKDQQLFRADPTWSTHNYKHANKAAAARRWEAKSGIAVEQTVSDRSSLANYKRQIPNQQPAGGITIDHTPSASLADRNYKIQRVAEPDGTLNEGIVKRRKRQPDSTSILGNE